MKYFLAIFFLLLVTKVFSQTDTAKWDPSDPNCPCHKLEQQAEEEWRRMQEADLNNIANSTNVNHQDFVITPQDTMQIVHQQYSAGAAGDHSGKVSTVSKLIVMKKEWRRWRGRMGKKYHGKRQHRFRVAECFHFN